MFYQRIFLCLMLPVLNAVDLDYYYLSSPLRSRAQDCTRTFYQEYCQLKCGEEKGICWNQRCYCFSIVSSDVQSVKKPVQLQNAETKLSRPALRHHIAHFCPNLNVARDCIRKCMEEGKPAFCGKDHVCYCGHRYSHHDKNDAANAEEIYSQFKDLYQKYFGTDTAVGNHE